MKIRICGMNTLQNTRDHFLKQQIRVCPSHYSLVHCMEDMGWQVDQRAVQLGEDLSGYDKVIVYLHNASSFIQYLWSGLYAIKTRPDAIIAFDDWQIEGIYSSLSKYGDALVNDLEAAYRPYLIDQWSGDATHDEIKSRTSEYIEAIEQIKSGNNNLLISAFAGGDVSLLNIPWNKDRIFTYNPNPYHLNRNPENNFGVETVRTAAFYFEDPVDLRVKPEHKKREWNFASLLHAKTRKWLKGQDIAWNINFYGAKAGEFKCERKTEDEMCKVFNSQWGCLMPSYSKNHAKSGWWRARPLQVAQAGSILVSSKEELMVLYRDEFAATVKPADVESMDLTQLTDFARAQSEALNTAHPLDKMIQQTEVKEALGL